MFSILEKEKQIISINDYNLKNLVHDKIMLESIIKKDSIFILEGSQIIEGTCIPYRVRKISFSKD